MSRPDRSHVGRYTNPELRDEAWRRLEVRLVLKPCASAQDAAQEAAQVQGANRPAREHYIHGPGLRAALLLAERDHARDLACALEQELARALIIIDQKERP